MRGIHHRLKNSRLPERKILWKILFFVCMLFALIFLIHLHLNTSSAVTASPAARIVYGQSDFQSNTLYPAGAGTLKNASALAVDPDGGLYVVDYGNNRVLHFPSIQGTGAAPNADRVYGQPDFTSSSVGKGQNGLNYPHGVAIDTAGGLYIADMFNNRILHYPAGNTTADRVYGQTNFVVNKINGGNSVSASSLYQPQGIVADKSGLYVADSGNNRVLRFPPGSTVADRVYGQGRDINFQSNQSSNGPTRLNTPRDVRVDSTGLYVADTGNNRVIHYKQDNPVADLVYGQPDFFATQVNQGQPHPTATTLNVPTGIALDKNSGLYVADRKNNRIIYYAPLTKRNNPAALRIYGQNDYVANGTATTARSFSGPGAVAISDAGEVFALDIFNQRVLKFVSSLSIPKQPPASVKPGATFDLSATLQDEGSGIPFTDYNGPVNVQIKSGTGADGASIHGNTTVNASQGVAHFSGLSIKQAGTEYKLTLSSPGYASTETNAFAITQANSASPTSMPNAPARKTASSETSFPGDGGLLSIILACLIVLTGSIVAIRMFRKRI